MGPYRLRKARRAPVDQRRERVKEDLLARWSSANWRSSIERVRELIRAGEVRISEHGYDELAEDGLMARELLDGVQEAVVIEHYPDYPKGPCVLVLQRAQTGEPIHVVWGIPRGHAKPAVLVTAYRPDPQWWDSTFTRRRSR